MDTREQLLKTLMQDLEAYKLPNRYTAEEIEKIKSGRKSQASIDEGRRQIEKNEAAYNDAVKAKGELQKRVTDLQDRIEGSTRQAAEDQRRADQESPTNQAIQYGKSIGIPAAGYAAGHVAGAKFGTSYDTPPKTTAKNVGGLAKQLRALDKTAPASKAQASGIIDTYDKTRRGRPLTQFVGPAALAASSVATQMGANYADDPTLKEGLNLAANAERYGAAGMTVQQVFDSLRNSGATRREIDPTDVSTIEGARREINAGGKFDNLQGPIAEKPPAAPAKPAAKPGAKPGTVPALRAELEARGIKTTTKMRKPELEKAMAKALRAAGKAPKALVPLAIGAGVYDSLTSPASAEGDEGYSSDDIPVVRDPPMSRGAAAVAGVGAAGGAAGAIEGGRRLASKAMEIPAMATALRGLGRVAGPVGGAMTAYDVGSSVLGGLAQGSDVAGADADLRNRNLPFMRGQEQLRQQAYGEQPPQQAAPEEELAPELAPIAAAAEQDPELAQLLHEIAAGRMAEAGNQDPMSTALQSQSVAAGGNPFAAALRNLSR